MIDKKIKQVRHLLVDKTMTIADLAKKLDVSYTYLSNNLAGTKQSELLDKAISILKEV